VKTYIKRHGWTEDETAIVQDRYPSERTDVIARDLGLTPDQVHTKAHAIGLHKTREFLRELGKYYAARAPESVKQNRFDKGNIPWNKDKPFPAKGRSVDTQFKKHAKPHSYAPIGSERVTKDGYLQRKMTDTGYVPHDWIYVHHIVWMDAGNPRPNRSEALVFRDGNKRNFALENLELISRKALMLRNSLHRHGTEIYGVIQLRGALNRIINRRSPKG